MSATPPAKADPPLPSKRGFSYLKSLVLPVVILILLFGALEIFARSSAAAKVFPLRSYGNYHAQFEIKWHKLEQYVQENGGVDVILLGSSMVNTGIDPAVFAETANPIWRQTARLQFRRRRAHGRPHGAARAVAGGHLPPRHDHLFHRNARLPRWQRRRGGAVLFGERVAAIPHGAKIVYRLGSGSFCCAANAAAAAHLGSR